MNDKIYGTPKDDIITGRKGQDRLTGRGGSDTFVFRFGDSSISKPDLITDFRPEDKIQIPGIKTKQLSRINMKQKKPTNQQIISAAFKGLKPYGAVLVSGQGTNWLVANDGIRGQSANDLLIQINGPLVGGMAL